jgi:hypothetical protein
LLLSIGAEPRQKQPDLSLLIDTPGIPKHATTYGQVSLTLAVPPLSLGVEPRQKQPDLSLLDTQRRPEHGTSTNAKEKLRPAPHAPGDIVGDRSWVILPRTDIYEVVPSRLTAALARKLPGAGFVELSELDARAYTGHYYSCSVGKRPFLVRAVHANDGFTGRFRLERNGNSVEVVWGCLGVYTEGNHGKLQETALVVNLDFTPDDVYLELSSIP